MKTRNILGTALITTALLTGCGGGGGDSTPSQDQQALQALSGYNVIDINYGVNQNFLQEAIETGDRNGFYVVEFESSAVVNCTALGFSNPQQSGPDVVIYQGADPVFDRCREFTNSNYPAIAGNLNFAFAWNDRRP